MPRRVLAEGLVFIAVVVLPACGSSSAAQGGPPDTGHKGDGGGMMPPGQTGVAITPKTVRVAPGGTVQFVARVDGTSDQTVTWTVQEGQSGGTISDSGQYQAPTTSGTFHVVATSKADSSKSDSASVTVAAPAGTRPVLEAGKWANITPQEADVSSTFGSPVVEVDPTDPSTLYLCVDQRGLWKTTDAGTSWTRLGTPPASGQPAIVDGKTNYLDSPIRVRVDPRDPQHLIATQGVRGDTIGFWVSSDGGATWTKPQGFSDIAKQTTGDVTTLAVDPTDFDHILLGAHQAWQGIGNAGFVESKDGGNTWTKHDPQSSWSTGSTAIQFLYSPSLKIGDAKTWLFADDASGFWRTTDAGATWTKVSDSKIAHGGSDIYYTKAGVLYAGAHVYPIRSTDNGVTWKQLDGLPNAFYYTVQGDGNTLYTQISYTGDNAGRGPQPYYVSSETDGLTWNPYQNGAQTFNDGPYIMRFDSSNGIMYSANWKDGLWALKVLPP
jgi:photosystem II stability/assembly factor-like uncharacterized protein